MADGTAETKAAKFSPLASARIKRAAKAINLVGALAWRSTQRRQRKVEQIESYLNAAVAARPASRRQSAW